MYCTSLHDPPFCDVVKKCYKRTCRSYVGGDCIGIIQYHKIEALIFITIMVLLITCGVMFHKLAYQACPDRQLLLAFGGLIYCLPLTIFIGTILIFGGMYMRKVWISATNEARTDMLQQPLTFTNEIESESEYAVRIYTDENLSASTDL